jgi:FlaA1/EpsC-like NDP-sugar epimerase
MLANITRNIKPECSLTLAESLVLLLAAMWLYFSTYKTIMQYASIADKNVIFTYIMKASLIGTFRYLFIRKQQKFNCQFYPLFPAANFSGNFNSVFPYHSDMKQTRKSG